MYWILLAAWIEGTALGADAPDDSESTISAPRIALRGVAEMWDDTSIGTTYRTGALSGGAALILPVHERIALDAVPKGVVVCNNFEHENAVSEWVLMAMIALDRQLLRADKTLRAGSWEMSGRYGTTYTEQ